MPPTSTTRGKVSRDDSLPLQNGKDSSDSSSFVARSTARLYALIATPPGLTSLIIAIRVEVFRAILNESSCSKDSLHVSILLSPTNVFLTPTQCAILIFLAASDKWIDTKIPLESLTGSHKGGFKYVTKLFLSRARYAIPCLTIMCASLLGPNRGALRSTLICPTSSSAYSFVPYLQILGIVLDCFILKLTDISLGRASDPTPAPALVGNLLLVNVLFIWYKMTQV